MRKLLFFLFFLITITFGRDLVLVSVYPFYDVVRGIAGEGFKVESLVPPKADYHMYELGPRDIIKLHLAKVLFVSGVPLGEWEEKIEKITEAKVFKLSEGIELLSYGHKELGKDPHFWLSPARMLKVAENVYNAFGSLYGEEGFKERYEKVNKKLTGLHERYERTLSSCQIKRFGAVHPAFGYLAKDYGLEQVVIREEHGHGDISPKELARIVKEIKRGKLKVILAPKGVFSKVAQVLKEEYGVEVYEINVKIIPEEEGDNYFKIMNRNLKTLRKALRCQ